MAEQKDAARAKDRGPVEEIISKRLRPLNKKIVGTAAEQRFRSYHDKPADTLNDDQRAGLASLPQLEAAARELEELVKHVEEAELVTAAKAREEREAAERAFEARVAERLAETQLSLASTLGHFLNLHTLLHPARPDDHDNLTFGPLTLPLRLQDEVLATDILRVARMYDDLTSGGDGAHTVIITLTSGPTGEDEENDRIHRLLELIAGSDPEAETEPESAPELDQRSNVPEPPQSVQDELTSAAASTTSSVDPQRTPVLNRSALREVDEPAVMGTMPRGMALNFLQEDELAPKDDEDEYEVIEPPSGVVSSRASISAGTPNEVQVHVSMSGDATPVSADEVVAGVAGVSLDDAEGAHDSADASAEASASGAEGAAASSNQPRRNRQGGGGQQGGAQGQGQRKPSARKPRKDVGRGKPQQGVPSGPDEDGFEVKVSRRASSGQRGRGGPGGGGRGCRGGGRGGAPRGERTNNNNGERGERGAKENGRPKREGGAGGAGGAAKAAQSKPSSAKAAQPAPAQ